MKRRQFVAAGTFVGASLATLGCVRNSTPGTPGTPGIGGPIGLVDAHCHLFNGSDLPSIRFIKIVVLHMHSDEAIRSLDIDDPDVVDGLLALFTWIVGRTKAPSASDEIKVLQGQTPLAANSDRAANDNAVIGSVADFATGGAVGVAGDQPARGVTKIRRALLKSAGETSVAAADVPLSPDSARLVAERAYRSSFDLGLLLRWFGLFTRYRYSLAEQLAADHARQNFRPLLLCPALVDYDNWLGEHVQSPLPEQVEVMGRVALRESGPAVHGYVAFDPLRQVLFDEGLFTGYNPLKVVGDAIQTHGFIGIKLYPPMGFKAMGNADNPCQTYPDIQAFQQLLAGQPSDSGTAACSPRPADGSRLVSQKLDSAMRRVFDLCAQEQASVIAHTNDSNESVKDYGKRADPYFWLQVFERWKGLRVCLAHFGHFQARSASAPEQQSLPDASWEWTLGKFLKANPSAPVYADISYLTEVFGRPAGELDAYTAVLKRWLAEFDPDCRHLIFGTDWTMLGLDKAYETYSGGIYEYLRTRVFLSVDGMDKDRLQRLFVRNAAMFLGLERNGRTRSRLEDFYRRNGLPASRVPDFGI